MKNNLKIVLIDDNLTDTSPLYVLLSEKYGRENTILITDSKDALKYLEEHYPDKMIILLDIKFPFNSPDGNVIFNKLREFTNLIPVIIWTAADEKSIEFKDFINKHAFAFIKQSADNNEIIDTIGKAEIWLNSKISSVIEEWIENHSKEEKEKPYIIDMNGKPYNMNEVVEEINKQTSFGIELEKDILYYTIDKLKRINDAKKS